MLYIHPKPGRRPEMAVPCPRSKSYTLVALHAHAHKYGHFTASEGCEDDCYLLILFDMCIYSLRSVQSYSF